ncbi:MAG: HTH-type transcriptional repressor RspR [Pseudomonadota bacterium]|jgi:DNA-binding GntR family transcriptional regulator
MARQASRTGTAAAVTGSRPAAAKVRAAKAPAVKAPAVKATAIGAPAAKAPARRSAADDALETLADRAFERIESMLVKMEIRPGALMSEPELARRLGMSRTPVGEAMKRLARAGLVTILPRRGFIATELNVTSQLRLLELRREVTRLVTRAAALRADAAQRAQLAELARAFVAAAERGDEPEYMRIDQAFHALIARCADNDYAVQVLESLDSQARRFFFAHPLSSDDLRAMGRLHADIATAVVGGDAADAGAASDALADALDRFTRSTIDAVGRLDRPAPVAA